MSAGKNAKAIGLKGWLDRGKEMPEEVAKYLLPKVFCVCGWTGGLWELLDEKSEDETLWCPTCLNSSWKFEI